MKLSKTDSGVIQLLLRSPDDGNGWRNVSETCWPLIEGFEARELLIIDEQFKRVRLSEHGEVVAMYLC